MANLFTIIIGSIFVSNYVVVQFLGICPALGVSSKVETAAGMGASVTFVITLASAICWAIQRFILDPLSLGYLQTIVFILVIASLVQFVEMALKKLVPSLYNALGIYLPLITTNCIVLGVAIVNITSAYNLVETIINGISASVGFAMVIILLAAIRERLELTDVPDRFKGMPIALVSLGLMSIAFMGFAGLV